MSQEAGGGARRPSSIVVIGVLLAVVASALWWGVAGRLLSPGQGGKSSDRAPQALLAQAATGGAIAGTWAPAATGPPAASYQVRVVRAGSSATVASALAWSPSVVVGGLARGVTYQLVVTPSGQGAAATSAAVTVVADRPPDPPIGVVVGQLPGTNGLRATWTPARSGVAAIGAIAELYVGTALQGQVICQARCTSAVFRGLPYGRSFRVTVTPTNAAGGGVAAASNVVALTDTCRALPTCVTIDATSAGGPARLRAQGFLNSIYPVDDMVARAKALHPQSWRGSPNYLSATGKLDWSSWDASVATGARTTLLLSNLWHAETTTTDAGGTGARTSWSDWGAYRAWVTATVRTIEASGHAVSFWEVQNEPGSPGYYRPADWAASTAQDYLEQFQVAYQAIKAVDPNAQIVGPSLSHFADYPGEYDPHEPDLVSFLDFAASHGLRLAAVAWHEIDDSLGPQPRDFDGVPGIIEDHVAEARRLIAERPALGQPQVWVNEYGRPSDYAIPGWTLGDVAALEQSSVDRAGRSCWPEQTDLGSAYDDCPSPTLDGLLAQDGSTPRADYWVYATYARMTGRIVANTSSDATVPVLAARDDTGGRVVAMVGRDVGCLPGVNLSCTGADAVSVAPIGVGVSVRVPWAVAAVAVTIARVPATWGPVPQPSAILHGPVAVVGGVASLTLPAFADGDVYLITVSR